MSSLRGLYRYLQKEELLDDNPFLLVESLKEPQRQPDFLYMDEMLDLLDSIDTHTVLGRRNKAMLELMYASGYVVWKSLKCSCHKLIFPDSYCLFMEKVGRIVMCLFMIWLPSG